MTPVWAQQAAGLRADPVFEKKASQSRANRGFAGVAAGQHAKSGSRPRQKGGLQISQAIGEICIQVRGGTERCSHTPPTSKK